MSQYIPSVCPHDCPSACALEVERIDERTIGKIRGAKSNSYTKGVVCSKVAKYSERVHHPDRLSVPLKRTGPKGSAQFEVITWDEAIDTIAQRFKAISDEHGSEAVWPYQYGGTMGRVNRDGIHAWRHELQYSKQAGTICTQIAYNGWFAGVGAERGSDPRDVQHSELIVIWGGNLVASQVNFMKHVAEAKRNNGAKLVVIDPVLTGTARKADMHLAPKPGTDGALACAVMHELFKNDRVDRDYLARYTRDADALEVHVSDKSAQWAAPITGLSVDEIKQFSALYGNTKKTFIRLGIGFSRVKNGALNVHAVSCLPALTGAWSELGGGALCDSAGLFKLNQSLIEGTELCSDSVRTLDMSLIGRVLSGDAKALVKPTPVKALFVQNSNPMVVAPESALVKQGFMRDDLFTVVHEQFMTDTAKMADILLPATTFLEHEDLYSTYGQVHLQYAEAVIKPFAQCKSNHEVIKLLASKMELKYRGFGYSTQELADNVLSKGGYPSVEQLKLSKWHDASEGHRKMNFLDGFHWPDKKFRFKPDWYALGDVQKNMPELPDYWPVQCPRTDDRPYQLITPPARHFLNSTFSESPSSVAAENRPTLGLNPSDAEKETINEGDLVVLSNNLSSVWVHAKIVNGVKPGVLEVRGLWPNSAFVNGLGINALIDAEPVLPSGGVSFHDAAVALHKSIKP